MQTPQAADFLVDVGNPAALDRTLLQMGAALVQEGPGVYKQVEGHYIMRALRNPDFVRFACESQGYCKIVRKLDQLV